MTLSGGPESYGNEGVLRIPQSSSITGTSPSNCLVSYAGHSLVMGYIPLCIQAIGVFYSPSPLGKQLVLVYFYFCKTCCYTKGKNNPV